jgi:hypothetical protein
VLLFIDEPALCLGTLEARTAVDETRLNALRVVLNDVRERNAYAGLHCCAASPFRRMCRAEPDILSFDAHEGLEQFFADEEASAFVNQGGIVAYGMIPTWSQLSTVDSTDIFTRWLKAASMVGDPQELARHAMVTATCGLGLLDDVAVTQSFKLAHEVGQKIRALAGDQQTTASAR